HDVLHHWTARHDLGWDFLIIADLAVPLLCLLLQSGAGIEPESRHDLGASPVGVGQNSVAAGIAGNVVEKQPRATPLDHQLGHNADLEVPMRPCDVGYIAARSHLVYVLAQIVPPHGA